MKKTTKKRQPRKVSKRVAKRTTKRVAKRVTKRATTAGTRKRATKRVARKRGTKQTRKTAKSFVHPFLIRNIIIDAIDEMFRDIAGENAEMAMVLCRLREVASVRAVGVINGSIKNICEE